MEKTQEIKLKQRSLEDKVTMLMGRANDGDGNEVVKTGCRG